MRRGVLLEAAVVDVDGPVALAGQRVAGREAEHRAAGDARDEAVPLAVADAKERPVGDRGVLCGIGDVSVVVEVLYAGATAEVAVAGRQPERDAPGDARDQPQARAVGEADERAVARSRKVVRGTVRDGAGAVVQRRAVADAQRRAADDPVVAAGRGDEPALALRR